MGYFVTVDCDVVILDKNLDKFWEIARENEHNWTWKNLGKVKTTDIRDVFDGQGFSISRTDKPKGWAVNAFEGDKYHSDWEEFFENIAPVIKHGGHLMFDGEDGEKWKWSFLHGQMVHFVPRIVWEDEGCCRIIDIENRS